MSTTTLRTNITGTWVISNDPSLSRAPPCRVTQHGRQQVARDGNDAGDYETQYGTETKTLKEYDANRRRQEQDD